MSNRKRKGNMHTPSIGTIEVTVRLRLEKDVDEQEARDIVENCDYEFNYPLIQETEIIGDDISERIEMDIDTAIANGEA
jgi:hypothetical protein